MKELQLEAEKYTSKQFFSETGDYEEIYYSGLEIGFIAGATSKYVKKEKLEFAIEQFKNLTERKGGYSFKNVNERLEWLEQQLKQLENE